MKILIVSRHQSTIDLLSFLIRESRIKATIEIKNSIITSDLEGYDLIMGNIPLSLLYHSKWKYYVNISLVLPSHLRGKELDKSELIQYGSVMLVKKRGKSLIWMDGGSLELLPYILQKLDHVIRNKEIKYTP